MDGANTVTLDDGRKVQLKEMGNGCYVELFEQAENPSYSRGQPDGYEKVNSQFLLKTESVFQNIETLPVSDDLRLRLGTVLENAVEWLEEGDGAEKRWFDDVTREDKLLNYIDSNWRDDDSGLIEAVAFELVEKDLMLCNRSGDLFTLGKWGSPTGSYVATIGADEQNKCPNCGAPKDKFWECIRSSHRTRVADRYKCQNCGATKKGITTG